MDTKQVQRIPMNVVGYARVSTKDQAKKSRIQKRSIIAFCKKNCLNLVAKYFETKKGCVPAFNRKKIKQIMSLLDMGKAEGIVINEVDRLSRSVSDWENILKLFEEKGYLIFLASEDKQIDFNTDREYILNEARIAEYESKAKSNRSKKAAKYLRDNNKKTGGPNEYGFNSDSDNNRIINIEEHDVIDKIIYLRDKEHYTYRQIVTYLDRRKIRTKLGHKWTPAGVRSVYLKNKQ